MEEFYLVADGHEVRILRTLPRIIAGRDPAEFPEVIDEVGLIVVAAFERKAGGGVAPQDAVAKRNDYFNSLAACLQSRGYSVR